MTSQKQTLVDPSTYSVVVGSLQLEHQIWTGLKFTESSPCIRGGLMKGGRYEWQIRRKEIQKLVVKCKYRIKKEVEDIKALVY